MTRMFLWVPNTTIQERTPSPNTNIAPMKIDEIVVAPIPVVNDQIVSLEVATVPVANEPTAQAIVTRRRR